MLQDNFEAIESQELIEVSEEELSYNLLHNCEFDLDASLIRQFECTYYGQTKMQNGQRILHGQGVLVCTSKTSKPLEEFILISYFMDDQPIGLAASHR